MYYASGHRPFVGSGADGRTLPVVDVAFVLGKEINS